MLCWSTTFPSLLLLLLPLIPFLFFLTSQSHLSHKPPPSLLTPSFLSRENPKDDLAYFFSAFMSREGHVIVLLLGHTSLKGERWSCQIVRGEECSCSVHPLGLRNFQSESWGVQRLECKFKFKGEVNSIRLRRGSRLSGQCHPFVFVSDPIGLLLGFLNFLYCRLFPKYSCSKNSLHSDDYFAF